MEEKNTRTWYGDEPVYLNYIYLGWKGTLEGHDGDEPVNLNYIYLGWKRRENGYDGDELVYLNYLYQRRKRRAERYNGDEPVYLNYVYLGWKRRAEGYDGDEPVYRPGAEDRVPARRWEEDSIFLIQPWRLQHVRFRRLKGVFAKTEGESGWILEKSRIHLNAPFIFREHFL